MFSFQFPRLFSMGIFSHEGPTQKQVSSYKTTQQKQKKLTVMIGITGTFSPKLLVKLLYPVYFNIILVMFKFIYERYVIINLFLDRWNYVFVHLCCSRI